MLTAYKLVKNKVSLELDQTTCLVLVLYVSCPRSSVLSSGSCVRLCWLGQIVKEETEDSQLKGPVNIFNKIIEENFPKLKNEMPISEAYRIPNRLDQNRYPHHIIIKTLNALNKERILKAIREKRSSNI